MKYIMITTEHQQTRYMDEQPFDSEGVRIFEGESGKWAMKNIPQFGTVFIINNNILNSIINLKP